MSSQIVTPTFKQIIEDVISKSSLQFQQLGLDHLILDQLSQIWLQKLSIGPPPTQEQFLYNQFLMGGLPQNDGADDDESEDDNNLNSDLDDEDGKSEDSEEDDSITDLILCQYEKVTRNKNKWKCILKDGIIHINGKDYLFSKANGELEW